MLNCKAILVAVMRISLSIHGLYAERCHECEVGITLLAGQKIKSYIPQSSIVKVNCTANSTQTPVWSIRLPGYTNAIRFTHPASNRTLSSRGIYMLEDVHFEVMTTLQLLINTTHFGGHNRTIVGCDNPATGKSIANTTLVIFNLSPVSLLATGAYIQAVILSWIPSLLSKDINETYTLTAMSSGTRPRIVERNEANYVFNGPEGVQPCELYNFSVTATLVGTTGTRTVTGCSVPNEPIITMLPSLPNISRMESSVGYVLLKKRLTMEFELRVSFIPATYCEMYPVTSYVLQVEGPSAVNKSSTNLTSTLIIISVDNLLGDNLYNFSIVVYNSVGNLSTSKTSFYTTDVQIVRAAPLEEDNAVMLQCVFVIGSDATGCLVIIQLVNEADNTKIRLTREGMHNYAMKIVHLTSSSTYINEIFGFDIESNKSIGTLPVPGELVWNVSQLNCSSGQIEKDTTSAIMTIVTVVVVAIILLLVLFAVIIIIILLCFKLKYKNDDSKSIEMKPNEVYGISDDIKTQPNIVYSTTQKLHNVRS